MSKNSEKTQGRNYIVKITVTALMVALTIVLEQITLFRMPQGGSVTLFANLPIVALGYFLGIRWGLLGGAVTGLLDLIFGGYVIHPVQMILDYVIAYAVMGLSGLVRNQKHGLTKGYLIGIFCRYICAVLSGVIFFGDYAPEGFNALTWSLWYNITYLAIEGVMTIVIINLPPVAKMFERIKTQLSN